MRTHRLASPLSLRSGRRSLALLGALLLAAAVAVASTVGAAGASTARSTLLPPKPTLGVTGGGGEDGGGEGEGDGGGGDQSGGGDHSSGGGEDGSGPVGGLTAKPLGGTSTAPLGSGSSTASGSPVTLLSTRTRPSSTVLQLQRQLAKLGYLKATPNGNFGPATTAAVKRFQKANGLTPDGKWGPASQAMLTKRLSGR